ncbi:MAG: cobalamin-dependent protein [Deltaproteobacteria bacterium]|nr:cobalamin-dependent protein [Deltaproteobacteria bacterium]
MHVLFATAGYAESMGVEVLSAQLKRAGHQTSLVHDPRLFDDGFDLSLPSLARRLDWEDRAVARILEADPDLLAFSCVTATWAWARRVAARVRAVRPIPTVVGGPHASALPSRCLESVDFVCQGEGDEAMEDLTASLAGGGDGRGIRNVWTRADGVPVPPPGIRPFLADLDSLPLPDKDLYRGVMPDRGLYNVMTARGCPGRCTFCYASQHARLPTEPGAPWLRRRSVDHVLDELVWARRRQAFTGVEFHDDVFTVDPAWLERFLPRYHERVATPYMVLSQARYLDRERVRLLAATGCRRVKMGIQTLESREWKRTVLGRPEDEEDIARAIDACRAEGLRIEVDMILGFAEETLEGRHHALSFFRAHPPQRIATYWLALFPGTEILDRYRDRGLVPDSQWEAICDGEVVGYHHPPGREDPEDRDRRGHAAAFQLLPLLPPSARGLLRPALLGRVPGLGPAARWAQAAGLLASVARGHGDDALSYLRYYGRHLRRRDIVVAGTAASAAATP